MPDKQAGYRQRCCDSGPHHGARRPSSDASPLLFHYGAIIVALAADPPVFSATPWRGTVERRQFASTFAKYCFLGRATKTWPEGPDVGLSEMNYLASILVFGADRTRTPPIELVGQTSAQDVAVLPRLASQRREDLFSICKEDRPRRAAEVVVKILGFHRPIIRQGIFDATARNPANAGSVRDEAKDL